MSLATIEEVVLDDPEVDDTLRKIGVDPTSPDVNGMNYAIGCARDATTNRARYVCGYVFGIKFTCDCPERVVQRVTRKQTIINTDTMRTAPEQAQFFRSGTPPDFYESWGVKDGAASSIDAHVGEYQTKSNMLRCIHKRYEVCCGTYRGTPLVELARRDYIMYREVDERLLECCGPKKTYHLSFCYSDAGTAWLSIDARREDAISIVAIASAPLETPPLSLEVAPPSIGGIPLSVPPRARIDFSKPASARPPISFPFVTGPITPTNRE